VEARVAIPDGEPWSDARWVTRRLRETGFEAWFVGGCVRDLLLRRGVKDVDVATDAVPERVESLFERTIAVGKAFGVVIVVAPSGANIEVATFRHDGRYLDGRRPESVRYGTAVDDVERRDFTVNALLLDPEDGHVVDHVGGLEDLQGRRLRAVGDPAARLTEDRLRVLRALRFAAALALTIEPATWTAVRATTLSGLSGERIVQEWFKALLGDGRGRWLRLLIESGRLGEFCVPLAGVDPAALERSAAALDRIAGDDSLAARAAVWLAPAPPAEAAAWIARQPLEKAFSRTVLWLLAQVRSLEGLPRAEVVVRRRLALEPAADDLLAAARALAPAADGTMALAEAVAGERARGPHRPLVRADDLKALGVVPGPRLGELLRRLEDAQLAGDFTDRGGGLELARRLVAEGP
jgi:tRNA nucleotidyltransferase/poly(A) polymerase